MPADDHTHTHTFLPVTTATRHLNRILASLSEIELTDTHAEHVCDLLDALEGTAYVLRVKLMSKHNLGAVRAIREAIAKELTSKVEKIASVQKS